MATLELLSGCTNGDPIKIGATATPGTLLHTAIAATGSVADRVFLFVTNTDTTDRTITVEWGGATDPDHLICKARTIPASSGPSMIAAGLPVNNSNVIRAFASSANVLLITGYVLRSRMG